MSCFAVATGRLVLGFRKWYYNLCGFNKLGKLIARVYVVSLSHVGSAIAAFCFPFVSLTYHDSSIRFAP